MKNLHLYLSLLFVLTCAKEDPLSTNIPPSQFTLTVSAGDGGAVSTAGGTFSQGTQVNITAIPDEGFEFTQWSNGSTINPLNIAVTSDIEIIAEFSIKSYFISILFRDGGVNSLESGYFDHNSEFVLNANPNEGHYFYEWRIKLSDTEIFKSNENPLILNIDSEIEIYPVYISKTDLINNFIDLVFKDEEDYTKRLKETNVFLDGDFSEEFEVELNSYIDRLNNILINNNDFEIKRVNELSESNVHISFDDVDGFRNSRGLSDSWPDFDLSIYSGYAFYGWQNDGVLVGGNIFINSTKVIESKYKWIIEHEFGHMLGLYHTSNQSSVMHTPEICNEDGCNEGMSPIDKEVLRLLYDDRIPIRSSLNEVNQLLIDILNDI
tara:strand:- start:45 stop:1181 length:1137 start_codon:yes stop_codon:yes gene_type:complete